MATGQKDALHWLGVLVTVLSIVVAIGVVWFAL
jgi:hypothetical protein